MLPVGDKPKRNFSPKQGARYLGIGDNLMYRMLAENRIPHARLGNRIIVSRESLDRLLAGDSTSGR
jgi:excisionase family DNA binding protein